jgi:hypothetical protein
VCVRAFSGGLSLSCIPRNFAAAKRLLTLRLRSNRSHFKDLIADGDGSRIAADGRKPRRQRARPNQIISHLRLALVQRVAAARKSRAAEILGRVAVAAHQAGFALTDKRIAKKNRHIQDIAWVVDFFSRRMFDALDLH